MNHCVFTLSEVLKSRQNVTMIPSRTLRCRDSEFFQFVKIGCFGVGGQQVTFIPPYVLTMLVSAKFQARETGCFGVDRKPNHIHTSMSPYHARIRQAVGSGNRLFWCGSEAKSYSYQHESLPCKDPPSCRLWKPVVLVWIGSQIIFIPA